MENNGVLVESKQMPSSILSTLNEMRKSGTWCDLRIEIPCCESKKENVVFNVHGCIVAAASKSLAVIVNKKLEHAVIKNVDSKFVSMCINYIYGKGIFVPLSDVPELLTCAQQLQLPGLVDICKARLEFQPGRTSETEDPTESLQDINEHVEISPKIKQERFEHSDTQSESPDETEEVVLPIKRIKLYSCSQCPLKFNRLGLVENHERKHREGATVPSLLQCSLCDFCSSTRREASLHKAWHVRENQLRCDDCRLAFKISLDYDKHFETKYHSVVTKVEPIEKDNAGVSTEEDSTTFQTLQDDQSTEYCYNVKSEEQISLDDSLNEEESDPEYETEEITCGTSVNRKRKRGATVKRKRGRSKKAVKQHDDDVTLTEDTGSLASATEQKTGKTIPKTRRYSSTLSLTKYRNKRLGLDAFECNFEQFADDLGVPEEIRPLLEPAKWPDHLRQGRFKTNPYGAYKLYYINQFKEYTCEVCNEVIRGKQRYDVHRRKEKGQYVYCSFCAKAFISQGSLKTHELRHKNQKDVKCELCDFKCYYKHKLKEHMQNVHGQLGGPTLHLCSQCPKTFKSAQSRTVHEMRVHNKDQWKKEAPAHRCEQCSYVGFSKRDVELHMMRHSKVKPYVCYICRRYAFKRVKELNKHIRQKHNEEPRPLKYKSLANKPEQGEGESIELLPKLPKPAKTYQCPHCEYNTTNNQNMKAHIVIHSDERPFPCPICGLGFKRKNVMVRHAWRLHKVDLRSVCYEYTDTGKKIRKELEPKLFLVEAPHVQMVTEGDVDMDMLGDVSEQQDVQQAIYATVGDDGRAIYTTVGDESASIYTAVDDSSVDPTSDPNQAVVLKAEDETYIHNLQLLGADSAKNMDINVIREVVVDSAAPGYDPLQDPGVSSHTISVPITDADGLSAETQIVIDSNVLKSMGLDSISAAQLKIISDTDN